MMQHVIFITLLVIMAIFSSDASAFATKRTADQFVLNVPPVEKDHEEILSRIEFIHPLLLPEDIVFYNEEGEKQLLESLKGKTILLYFWATWNTAAPLEMPQLDKLQKRIKDKDIVIITLSQDYKSIETIKAFFESNNLEHLTLYTDYKSSLFKLFDIVGLPTAIIINPDYEQVGKVEGPLDWQHEAVQLYLETLNES